jgi:hypothetical protein
VSAARPALLPLAAVLALAAPAAAGAERFDPRIREMLRRVQLDEDPVFEDQRTAARALRDWKLSERTAPQADQRVRYLLEAVARGERAPPSLRPLAGELASEYLTEEGLARRLRAGPDGLPLRRRGAAASGAEAPPESAGGWFLFLACLAIFLGGLLVWGLGRRRGRPDYRAYYS